MMGAPTESAKSPATRPEYISRMNDVFGRAGSPRLRSRSSTMRSRAGPDTTGAAHTATSTALADVTRAVTTRSTTPSHDAEMGNRATMAGVAKAIATYTPATESTISANAG